MLYILKQLGNGADFHKVFKILYFADQAHLTKYGTAITHDTYIAMTNGPVPSIAYDIARALRGDGLLACQKERFEPYFKVRDPFFIEALRNPQMDNLSPSERAALDDSIRQNKDLSFEDLTTKSHDSAWDKANRNAEMNLTDIAEAGGASDGLLEYIQTQVENQYARFE